MIPTSEIRSRRNALNLSQAEVARMIGCSAVYYRLIEGGYQGVSPVFETRLKAVLAGSGPHKCPECEGRGYVW